MEDQIALEDVSIRTELQPGDMGYVTYMHGSLYSKEYGYTLPFENYVAKGLSEFYEQYDRRVLYTSPHKNVQITKRRRSPKKPRVGL